jgi:hypothetical protein
MTKAPADDRIPTGVEAKLDIETTAVPCPYVSKSGRKCKGHIVRVEAFKADLSWTKADDGVWEFGWSQPRSHFHVYCSGKVITRGLIGPTMNSSSSIPTLCQRNCAR